MRVEQAALYRSPGRHGQHWYGARNNLIFFQQVEYQVYPGVLNIHLFLASLCLSLIFTFLKVDHFYLKSPHIYASLFNANASLVPREKSFQISFC